MCREIETDGTFEGNAVALADAITELNDCREACAALWNKLQITQNELDRAQAYIIKLQAQQRRLVDFRRLKGA